jgi:hypothetical protein
MVRGGNYKSEELWSTATGLRWLARDMRREQLKATLLALAFDCERQAANLDSHSPLRVVAGRGKSSKSRLLPLAAPTLPPAPAR